MHIPRCLAAGYRRIHSGVNYRLRNLAGGRWASHCRPASIVLLITERCNAKCVHCDIWKNRGQEDSPTVEQWKSLLSDLAGWLGPVHVCLSGGEALLRPYTPEVVRHGSASGLWMEVLTHGYWMEQSRIEQLARARPGRITISLDGIGETHSRIRGRDTFWTHTSRTLETLARLRREEDLGYEIRLKTVIMEFNLDGLQEVADFAKANGMAVFYQPIEQNYNTPEDAFWYERSETWPRDVEKAVRAVEGIIRLKRGGWPVANSFEQLDAMIAYFRNPAGTRVQTQAHSAHESRVLCNALTTLQIQANGDVSACTGTPAMIGNIKQRPIRAIWRDRPRWWEGGCCLESRLKAAGQAEELVRIRA